MSAIRSQILSPCVETAESRLCIADFSAKELMTEHPITVRRDERVDSVWQILQHIHHVVVTESDGNIVGIVSHRDLMRWSAAFIGKALPIQSSVETILQPFANSVGENTSLRTVAIEMLDRKYGCMPVTDSSGHLTGIITESDFVGFFSEERWRHPVRRGQTIEFQDEKRTGRTSLKVKKVRLQMQKLSILVQDCMSTDLQTLLAKQPIEDADNLMRRFNVRHVPIVDNSGELVGLLSQRDFLRIAIPEFTSESIRETKIKNANEPVSHYMRRDLITVSPHTPLTEAANLILSHRIGCVPVVEGEKLCGILSRSDFVRLFADGI